MSLFWGFMLHLAVLALLSRCRASAKRMLFGFIEYCFFIVSIFAPAMLCYHVFIVHQETLSFRIVVVASWIKHARWKQEGKRYMKNNHLLISFDIDYVLGCHKCRLLGKFYGSFEIICCSLSVIAQQHMVPRLGC